ncbi:MAG: hypothetical protein JSS04_18135 [Proteobacteria bacterium]|nr:hypothetical protein [Pseudomonadota bacterium]
MTLAFSRAHNVLHLRLSGVYHADDLDRFDLMALRFVETNGPVHMILDFSGTTALSVPAGRLARRGQLPPLCLGYERVMVMPRPELEEFGRTFLEHQRECGFPTPIVTNTLDEALRVLFLDEAVQFEPVTGLAD